MHGSTYVGDRPDEAPKGVVAENWARWDHAGVPSGRLKQVVIIAGAAAIFGFGGVVAAACSARDILRLPGTEATRAGPAWLLSGLGVGVVFGALVAVALLHLGGALRRRGTHRI
jgi:hypothetical protein